MEGEKLTTGRVAVLLSIKPGTWRNYVTSGVAPRADGWYDSRTPWWWRETVASWARSRPVKPREL